jgi:hypothetical protein
LIFLLKGQKAHQRINYSRDYQTLKLQIMKYLLTVITFLSAFTFVTLAGQGISKDSVKVGNTNPAEENIIWSGIGAGVGMDYGGLGINYTAFVAKNVGIFAGVGYAYGGAGYNFGTKLRVIPKKKDAKLNPFILGMWGYNAAFTATGEASLAKVFQGFTTGIGTDFRSKPNSKGYWSLAVLVPFHTEEVKNYKDYLDKNVPDNYQTWVHSVGFSIGYHWIIKVKEEEIGKKKAPVQQRKNVY